MSFDACAALTETRDPDRFASAMTAPPARRGGLMALYAFNSEVVRAAWITQEAMIAEMRLQWWVDVIDEIYAGKPARAHEVVQPLAETIKAHDLPRAPFDDLIAARRFDIGREGHADQTAFETYIDATSAGLMVLAARVLVPLTDETQVRAVGRASGLANLILALPALYAAGRDPVPVEGTLDRGAIARGEVPLALQDALSDMAKAALVHLRAARQGRRGELRLAGPALLAGWQVETVLTAVEKQPAGAFSDLRASEFRRRFSMLTGRW